MGLIRGACRDRGVGNFGQTDDPREQPCGHNFDLVNYKSFTNKS